MKRLCIYTKDIQVITGKSDRHCRKIIMEIKKLHNKEKHQPVSVIELCEYLKLNINDVEKILKIG